MAHSPQPQKKGALPPDPQIQSGTFLQRPPAYSAVRIGGERLYEKARRGEAVEGEPRPVTVHRAERLWLEGDRAAFEIVCSSGTYVRQLVSALGDAYCEELERTAIGEFRLEEADPERIVPLVEALRFMPSRELDPATACPTASRTCSQVVWKTSATSFQESRRAQPARNH